ncbi:uncharacterized protein J7T54_003227 [Emericellopsis cladophorae]|uniref:CwfJ domain protein n=1 Tax=Emericellopsis cladophorae TaxID=2686198 RepID=A0A9P9Y0F5_9HYPO|nr:uncharacterized protein J7T54_003227 [Emericellopsis cladophorae]KAI6781060.1 hypothetical protein J7T54_003227 [Emericellopsis cladophorae]
MMAAPKIIVLGSLNGNIEPALKKVASLHAKNSFALALLTGDMFTPETDDTFVDSLLDGSIDIPLPTYFTVGTHPLPPRIAAKIQTDEDICPNLHYLGKRSTTKTSDGIRIVSLGGQLDTNLVGGLSKEQHLPFHTNDDAKTLRGANSADILLTSMWPANVWKGSNVALDPTQQASLQTSEAISELCAALKPRYHLSASPGSFFYEREPFIHPNESDADPLRVTRFISMAPFGNQAKAKSMYAFTLNNTDTPVPQGVTASPFIAKQKRQAPADNVRYAHSGRDGHHGRGAKRRRQRSPPPGPDRCYFCLSNPNVSQHMLCSVGDETYVTVAKGPLPTTTTFADQGLDFPVHLIIIPIPHNPTIPSLGDVTDPAGTAAAVYNEMTRLREAIQAMVANKSNHKLGVVTWEISRDRNVHLIWQLMPIAADLIQRGLVEAAFKVEAENQALPAFVSKDIPLEQQASYGDFFRVWIWADNGEDKIKGKSIVMPLESDMRFDLQFGRRVMAKLMGLENRVVWQDCAQTEDEEIKDVEAFKKAFEEFDFTL